MTLTELTSPEDAATQETPPRRRWRPWLTGVVVLALLAGGAGLAIRRLTGLPGDAAFEYAGHVVTRDQLAQRVHLLAALYGISEPTGSKARAAFRRDTAKAVAVSMILDHLARSKGIVIADKSARDTLSSMISNQLGDDGQAQFTKILGQFGVSEKDVLDEVKRQQATARLFQSVTAKAVAGVTADDAQAYFQADPARFATPERRRIRNMVVGTRQQAQAVLAALRRGRDFAALARRRSLDDATRASGGDLGTVTATQLDSTYAAAAFGTPQGRFFGPVQTKFGWNVGEVIAVKPATTVTYDQVSAQVLDEVRSERAMKTWHSFLADQIRKAHVEYADRYRPAHPDAPPADQPGTQTGSLAGQP